MLRRIVSLVFLGVMMFGQSVMAQSELGYWTSVEELRSAKAKSDSGIEPYVSAYEEIVETADSSWPGLSSVSGTYNVDQTGSFDNHFFSGGRVLVAKAMRYAVAGNTTDAEFVADKILDITDVDFTGEIAPLMVGWQMPGWIQAAAILDEYPGWSSSEKRQFQQWLANEAYRECSFVGRVSDNNWGSACGYVNAMIGDYLIGSGITLSESEPENRSVTPEQAYLQYTDIQLLRMSWKDYAMEEKGTECERNGIMPNGGIPAELRRAEGTIDLSWCYLDYIPLSGETAYGYQITHLGGGTIPHAEMARRRGDNRLFDTTALDGSGSLKKAIYYIIENPQGPEYDWLWYKKSPLYPAMIYYGDTEMARHLYGGDLNEQESVLGNYIYFTQFTHGTLENPNVTITPTNPEVCKADIDQSGVVDASDYSILVANFLQPRQVSPQADINEDGYIDVSDYSILVANFLKNCEG